MPRAMRLAVVFALGGCAAGAGVTRAPETTATVVTTAQPTSAPFQLAPTAVTTTASAGDGVYDHAAGVDIVRHGAFCLPSDDTAALEAVSREVAHELASYPPRLLASAHLARVTL